MVKIILCLIFLVSSASAKDYKKVEETEVFSGRISRINNIAKLVRIKINFENAKFLAKNDRIEIWSEQVPQKKCLGYLYGRSDEYLLVRMADLKKCLFTVNFAVGSYIHMYSPDLENSLVTAKELVNVLHRKRTALEARARRHKKEVDNHVEKVDAINKRYEVLRQKLELEWQRELANLEDDKADSTLRLKQTKARLDEVDYKLQQYRVRDQNLVEDRWSLDPKLYYKK